MISLPELDETLGKYKIISVLGKGTTATVYKARHKYLNTDVALKVLSPKLISEDDSIKDRFLEEAMNHAKLSHNNFVRIIDVEDGEKYTYIVMEYIDGSALDDILKVKGSIPPLQVIKIILEICKALKYALELDIIHRDIKPGNIIITKNSQVKLADFGLAKGINEPDKHQKNAGQIFGTPNYMSPEQFIDSAGVDHRSDLYSLGATIYHLVTGKLPFETDSLTEIISMQINKIPVFPDQISPELSKEFSDIIMKLLAKKQSERYQNYSELIGDLEKAEHNYKYPFTDIEALSGTNKLEKVERFQKNFKKFKDDSENIGDLVIESKKTESNNLDAEKFFENMKKNVNDITSKPDIDKYVSQNVKKYLNNLEDKTNVDVTDSRLQEKYQKYFKKFQGTDLENEVIKGLKQSYVKLTTDTIVQKKEIKIDLPENLKNKSLGTVNIKKDILKEDISKEIKQSLENFNQENKVKISASKYIQKFKKLFEK